jgi:phosphoribosylaminoimidazole-succinocarboxamide synthase
VTALLRFDSPQLSPAKGQNKVRQLHDLGDSLLLITTDRISAFDVIMTNGIPDKGRVLNQMSAFWFQMFQEACPNHVLTVDDAEIAARIGISAPELQGRCLIAKKAQPLKIECVARGYLTGSLLKEYRAEGGKVHGLNLPDGLVDGSKLPEPIFTPATKAEEGHDLNLSEAQASDLVGTEIYETVKNWTLTLYQRAADYALSRGIILADTKFEFGETPNGPIWIDEALTPDSSRFWPQDGYQPGQSQPSFDKQFVRDYLEEIGFNKQPPGPELPDRVVTATRSKYLEAYERLTGKPLELD